VKIHVIHHPDEALLRYLSCIASIERKIMATLADLTQAVADVKTAVDQFPAAVDALEAKITAALANAGLTAEQQAAVDGAVADLRNVANTAQGAVTDAADGIDEAAATPAAPPSDGTTPTA
jgi:uncharacterized protein YoxC